MITLEELARTARDGHPLHLRSLVQDWLRLKPHLPDEPAPLTTDPQIQAIAAGLAEMFSEWLGQEPPAWAARVGPLPEPLYLVRSARTMRHLRRQCEEESPLPLRRRRLYAPPTFLKFA